MTIPRHTIKAICDLLDVDPNTTAEIRMDNDNITITSWDKEQRCMVDQHHRIQEKLHRPMFVAEGTKLAIRRPDAIRAREESPIFLETFVLHDGYITKVPPNPFLVNR